MQSAPPAAEKEDSAEVLDKIEGLLGDRQTAQQQIARERERKSQQMIDFMRKNEELDAKSKLPTKPCGKPHRN